MQKTLITQQGFQTFVEEFNTLLKIEKPHWVKEKEIAAAFGDRSENAEYISAKEMLRNIDKRLRFLDKIIKNSDVIDIELLPHDRINFGSKVLLVDLQSEEEKTFSIVGTFETNPSENKISNISPLGKVLLGKHIGDEIEFSINKVTYYYEILAIECYKN
jgi:transcription elongation factor GreA